MGLNKNRLSQIFTPDYIAEFMVKNIKLHFSATLSNSSIDKIKILEPSAGRGIFLKHILGEGFTDITAYELDQNLKTFLLKNYPNVEFKFENFLGSDANGKFDIIIGNPPHLEQNYNANIFQELARNYSICKKYFVGNMDLFYYFIHLGIDKLKPGGLLSFITTNYWLTKSKKTGIKYLKPHITKDCYMIQYIDLSRMKVFEDAKGQHNCIFVLQKKNSLEKERIFEKHIQIVQINKNKDFNTVDHQYNKLLFSKILDNSNHNSIKKYTSGLTNNDLSVQSNWNLLYPRDVKEIIMQIEKFCTKNNNLKLLGDYFSIRNGLILIKDEIFILKENKQIKFDGNDILIKIDDRFTKLNPNEKNRLKKFYKSRVIKPYGYLLEEQKAYLLFFNKSNFEQYDVGERDFQISRIYPNLSNYLKQFEQDLKEILKNANENRNDFYFPRRGSHIRQNTDKGLVNLEPLYDESPKIFFKFISQENIFGYTSDQYYATSDTYFMWSKKPTKFSLMFLLAYFNSKIVAFLFKSKSLAVKRSKTKIENGIPLPVFDKFTSKEKRSIIELVELLTKWLVYSANPFEQSDIYKFSTQLESIRYFSTDENLSSKEMIIKAMNDKNDVVIQEFINNLFYHLFDLDGNRIDYLIKEYYNA